MSSSYMPTRGAERVFFFTNFKDVAFANKAALGLTDPEFLLIETAVNEYVAAYNAAEDARLAAIAATATKNEANDNVAAIVGPFALEIKNNPSVSVALKALLGLTVTPTPSGPVVAPTSTTATGKSNGFIEIKWDRNGNSSRTTFMVQSKLVSGGEWTNLSISTATKVTTNAFEPGVPVQFRVLAFRGGVSSEPSNTAVVYDDEAPVTLLEAA